MYVFSVFCWSCMIDLGIGLELDGYISNFVGYYFAEGEPYLNTAHGTVINYWDGIVHFSLYLAIIGLYSLRMSHREVGLFWVGSILNSMVVLVPGGMTGKHPFKMSILLNVPYVLCPLLIAMKFLYEQPPQSRTFFKYPPIWRRPIDFLFMIYFVFAAGVAAFRGLVILGGNADTMKDYLKNYEPYMKDSTQFPLFQILCYGYFFLAYYVVTIYGLIFPGQHWMSDWSLIHAGAAAQAQFTYMAGSVHHRTPSSLHAPMSGWPGFVFWFINIMLLLVPQLFSYWCLKDYEKFGRTYSAERADIKDLYMEKWKPAVEKED